MTLSIASPAAGATVSGVTTIKVNAPGVQKVAFYVDGVVKSRSTYAPFSFDWYTTRYADGPHVIKVVSGNGKLSDSRTFNVVNAPVTTGFKTNLPDSSTDPNVIVLPFNWTFDPGEPNVVKGYFWVDGKNIKTLTQLPPYSLDLLSSLVTPGDHLFGHAWDLADGTHKGGPKNYVINVAGVAIILSGGQYVGDILTATMTL